MGKFPTVLAQNEDRIELYVACKELIVRWPCFSIFLAFLWIYGFCTGLDQLQKGDTHNLLKVKTVNQPSQILDTRVERS